MHLATALELAAHRYPEVDAIITRSARLSYARWNERVNAVAWSLLEAGLKPGDSMAIAAANGEAAATTFFALHKIGAVAVFLNCRWKKQQLLQAMEEAAVKAVLYDREAKEEILGALQLYPEQIFQVDADRAQKAVEGIPVYSFAQLAARQAGKTPPLPRDDRKTATVLFTSGTTGRARGVCRSGRSDYYAAMALIVEHRWQRFERNLAVMPLYHTMGLHALISMVLLNGTSLLLPRLDAEECLDYIHRGQVSSLYLVPTAYHKLVEAAAAGGITPCKVPRLAYAGAPMTADLVEQCLAFFQPDIFVNHYGCTEMLAITANPNLKEKPASAGRPALHSRIAIVPADRDGERKFTRILQPGQTGEIVADVSSPQAFLGYLHNAAATAERVRDGWYYTGDLGYCDEQGDLYLVGRVDDMIISGGENIYPREVEEILLSHPAVKEAAVVGSPDPRWGEVVTAFIVPVAEPPPPAELENFCRESPRLARFQRPRRYIFTREIPKSPAGKVLYAALRQRAASTGALQPPEGGSDYT